MDTLEQFYTFQTKIFQELHRVNTLVTEAGAKAAEDHENFVLLNDMAVLLNKLEDII